MPDLDGGRRLSIRLSNHNYSGNAAYLITLCTHKRAYLFGRVVDSSVELSRIGQLVQDLWLRTPMVRPGVSLDAFVVMPDHMHATVLIPEFGQRLRRTFPRPPRSLGSLIAGFKPPAHHRCEPSLGPRIFGFGSGTTMNDGSVMPPPLDRIRRYISANPARWVHSAASDNAAKPTSLAEGRTLCAPTGRG
jgi:putative transposase